MSKNWSKLSKGAKEQRSKIVARKGQRNLQRSKCEGCVHAQLCQDDRSLNIAKASKLAGTFPKSFVASFLDLHLPYLAITANPNITKEIK